MPYHNMIAQYPHLTIKEAPDLPKGLGGLYYDNVILLDKHRTNIEKNCLLAEELGHYHTTSGDIIDQSEISNIKQEKLARRWASMKLIAPHRLIESFEQGCRSRFEIAEYLNVTESFLEESLIFYKEKYGSEIKVDENYTLFLDPLAVFKNFYPWIERLFPLKEVMLLFDNCIKKRRE